MGFDSTQEALIRRIAREEAERVDSSRHDTLERRMDGLDTRLGHLETLFVNLDSRLARVERDVRTIVDWSRGVDRQLAEIIEYLSGRKKPGSDSMTS